MVVAKRRDSVLVGGMGAERTRGKRRADRAALWGILLRDTARVGNEDSLERVEDCGMRGVIKKAVFFGGGCRSRGASDVQELFYRRFVAARSVKTGSVGPWAAGVVWCGWLRRNDKRVSQATRTS